MIVKKMNKQEIKEKHSIKIEEITLEILKETCLPTTQERVCTLFWAKDNENIHLLFCSNDKSIRALEFMDYLIADYAIVQGDEKIAQAVLSSVFLQVMISEWKAATTKELLERITESYYTNCDWIYAESFSKEFFNEILEMPIYVKKQIAWAYVKTTDIIKEGSKFCLKSLENESDIILEASDSVYIMIGYRGEIYHINKDKFEQTYEATDELLNAYEQLLDYLPEIKTYEDKMFISLDEIAHLCYPKVSKGIYVTRLECRTKVFNPYNNGEYFVGRKDDFLAIRQDDLSDIYIIQKDIFYDTYHKA